MDKGQMAKMAASKVPLFAYIKLIVLAMVGLVLVCTMIFLAVDFNNSSEKYADQAKMIGDGKINSKAQFKKQYEYQRAKEAERESSNNGGISGNSDMWGNYPKEYYSLMFIYEAGSGPLAINKSDGGFGPYQATTPFKYFIDGIYNYDNHKFDWWSEIFNNSENYYDKGLDHSTVAGSTKIKDLAVNNLKTIEDYYDWYVACYSISDSYMRTAISKAETYTGKKYTELGKGTMAYAYAIAIRWGGSDGFQKCKKGMTEDQFIDAMYEGSVERAVKDKARWRCTRSIIVQINSNGLSDNPIQCDGSCGNGPHIISGNTVMELSDKAYKTYN